MANRAISGWSHLDRLDDGRIVVFAYAVYEDQVTAWMDVYPDGSMQQSQAKRVVYVTLPNERPEDRHDGDSGE